MYKTLGGIAAAFMVVAIAAPGTAAAQRQESGIHKQAVGEEFSSQRRRVRRASVRRYRAPSYGYSSWPYYAGYGSSPYPAAFESTRGYRYSARDNQASFSWGGPYYAGYGSSPYPASWESTRGYRYSARDNQASFSWGGPYYAGYGSSPYPAPFETAPRR
jgi:hypothetical protein